MSVRHRINYIKDEAYADDWGELWLRPGAPEHVLDAVYRALSRRYHPDLGEEDARAQQRINAAYTRLKARYAKERT